MRLDKYLKATHTIKRRLVASELCTANKVFINGMPKKPSYEVKIGDKITIFIGDKEYNHIVDEIPYEKKSTKK